MGREGGGGEALKYCPAERIGPVHEAVYVATCKCVYIRTHVHVYN